MHITRTFLLAAIPILLLAPAANAQLFQFSKQDLLNYTAQNPFDRSQDGRPRVPDSLIERAREMSAEEVWAVLPGKGFNNQYADGFRILHPGKKLVGRAFTVQFMPFRPDVDDVAQAKAKANGLGHLKNQTALELSGHGNQSSSQSGPGSVA